ncbi:hypothetical protein BDZ91DRAFT_750650 [Kalaharituber pfeilii]|nr:hypothetical protein BDZ91DRAFT_750650 [Kalaharituber pfeilii]
MEFSLKRKHFAEEDFAFLSAVCLGSKLTVECNVKNNMNRGATEWPGPVTISGG